MQGYVDEIEWLRITGWGCDEISGRRPAVDILVDGVYVGSAACNLLRPDVKAAGFGDGQCGFFFCPRPYIANSSSTVEVRWAGTSEQVPGGQRVLSAVYAQAGVDSVVPTLNGGNPWNVDSPMSYANTWAGSKAYLRHLNRQATGDPDNPWFDYVRDKYIMPDPGPPTEGQSCLLLGSNEGHMELSLCNAGFLGRIVASDIADKALARAREKITQLGYRNVEHVRADLNTDGFAGEFDIIVCEGVLHHITNIEDCLDRLSSCLKPDGRLILQEFVGAYRFQLPDLQSRWINAALSIVPKGLRPPLAGSDDGDLFPASPQEQSLVYFVPPSEAAMLDFDPSEAVSGHKLLGELYQRFDVVEENRLGGSLMMYLADHFAFDKTNHDELAQRWLGVLCSLEECLNEAKVLPPENMFMVLKNRQA